MVLGEDSRIDETMSKEIICIFGGLLNGQIKHKLSSSFLTPKIFIVSTTFFSYVHYLPIYLLEWFTYISYLQVEKHYLDVCCMS